MSAYISTELNMVKELDPQRHELALQISEFLEKGGTIEVLQGPSFVPPRVRHEPPPSPKAPKATRREQATSWIDKMERQDLVRAERVAMREKEKADQVEYIRHLALTLTYAQTVMRTGIPLRELRRIAKRGEFKFQPAINPGNTGGQSFDEARDARYAEAIKDLKARGFSRNQARESIQTPYKNFERLLAKFNIDYPKRRAGPHPAFFAKQQ